MAQLIRRKPRRSHSSRGQMKPTLAVGAVAVAVMDAIVVAAALGAFRCGVVIERESAPISTLSITAATPSAASTPEPATDPVFVHIDGAVVAPGVYEMTGSLPRVNDAVMAAGGLAGDADTSALNLAAVLSDGEKIYVPRQGEVVAGQASSGAASGSDVGASSSGVININTATAEELDSLPGIGPSTAAAIVEDRERNGPFASPEDLMRVSGIGEGKFSKLKDQIRV